METSKVNSSGSLISIALGGLYAWMTAMWFGAILLDIVYSKLLLDVFGATEVSQVFSQVSDFLLRVGFVVVLGAAGAIILSWRSRSARVFFIASLVVISIEFVVPLVGMRYLSAMEELGIGYLVRLAANGLATILAFIGLYKLYRGS